jgi:hypothetical protein
MLFVVAGVSQKIITTIQAKLLAKKKNSKQTPF